MTRLARLLYKLLPKPEAGGLLALMLLHQSRNAARTSIDKPYISLEMQDRGLWDKQSISEARLILLDAMSQGSIDKYQLQAAISAVHAQATNWQQTDWLQIVLLYQTLYKVEPSPVIKLNGLVALAQTGRVEQALYQLSKLTSTMNNYQPYYAARAAMENKLGLIDAATASYGIAIKLSNNEAEKDYLRGCLQALK